ncbi:unnamed protein product [Symbiodinium natans]|nr:unnamed protein product [Symbiodinium natans]
MCFGFACFKRSRRRGRALVAKAVSSELPGTDLLSTAPPLENGGAKLARVRRLLLADPRNEALDLSDCREPPFSDDDLREAWHELQVGHVDEARELFVRAVLSDPADAEALFCMGLLYESLHDLMRTVQWMDMAIEAFPDHIFAWETRSRCMEHLGHLAEALAGYEHLEVLDPSATGRREGLLGHQRVYILPVGAWETWEHGAAEYIRRAAKEEPRRWQENFVRPQPETELLQPALESGIVAWDDVLSDGLVQKLQECVEDHFQFIFTNRWVYAADDDFPGAASTMWLPGSEGAKTVPEVAALTILRHILQQEPGEFAGVEYWARVRSVNLGAGFHYDEAVDADANSEWVHGNPWRPQWSSVFYLTDEGGPTVVLDQLHDHQGRLTPALPRKAYLSMPRTNRLVIFRADLHHGSLPVDIWLDTKQTRRVFVFNFWRRHAPEPPHCQRLDFRKHPAMQRHILTAEEAAALQAIEASRLQEQGPTPVEQKVLSRPEELPHSSDFGYLSVPLPMPTMATLKEGSLFYKVDWLAAAQEDVS